MTYVAQNFGNVLSQLRLESKALENISKPPLTPNDSVCQTKDFVFSPFHPHEDYGDSGPLLLAKHRKNKAVKYVVKHAYTDCAANEFIYTKLAQSMGLKMPNPVLFQISPEEKRRHWKTEYILGTQFLDLDIEAPTYEQIREKAHNWQDYFHFRAMYDMCMEADSFETPLATDGFIYRIDTSASFVLADEMMCMAGIHKPINGIIPSEFIKSYLEEYDYSACLNVRYFTERLSLFAERYTQESIPFYLDTFKRLLDIKPEHIDSYLNILCYFYPDLIGDYFKRYIDNLMTQSQLFLKNIHHTVF